MTKEELISKYNSGERSFVYTNLRGANLGWANLSRANLSGANLSWANLSRANLSGANLSGANLNGANLSGANLNGVILSRADLSRADLSWANLSWANLSRAELSWANLSRAIGIVELPVGDPRGYRSFVVKQADGSWRVFAGCRSFTGAQAREHWGPTYEGPTYEGCRDIGDRYLRALRWFGKQLKAGKV
jgi:hypothetical protein